MAKNILHMMTPLAHMSPFDVNMALDAGYDATASYTNVSLDEITGLVQDAMFSRSPRDATRTGVFIGGKDALPRARHARRRRQGALEAVRDFAVRRPCRLVHHRRRDDRRRRKDAEGEEGPRASRRRRLGVRRDRRRGNRVGRHRRARGRVRHLRRARGNRAHGPPRRRGQSQVRRRPCRRRRLDAARRRRRSSRRPKSSLCAAKAGVRVLDAAEIAGAREIADRRRRQRGAAVRRRRRGRARQRRAARRARRARHRRACDRQRQVSNRVGAVQADDREQDRRCASTSVRRSNWRARWREAQL